MRTLSAGRSPHVRRQRCHRVHLRMRMLYYMIYVHTYMYMCTCASVVERIVKCGLYAIPHTGDAIAAPIVCILSHRCTRIYTPCTRTVYICVHAYRDIATPASMSGPPASGVVGGVYCFRSRLVLLIYRKRCVVSILSTQKVYNLIQDLYYLWPEFFNLLSDY